MGLIDAGDQARLDRYIGYYEPYATSHDALDRDEAVQEEARNVARAVARATRALRSGELQRRDRALAPAAAEVILLHCSKIRVPCELALLPETPREPDPAENPEPPPD